MAPQHHIIKETSDSLQKVLEDEFKRSGYKRVHIIDEAPKPEAIEGKLPAVSIYLYQVALDHEGIDGHVHSELVTVEREDGSIEEYRRRRRLWIRLEYLISTWAQTPEDEQLLMGLVIRTVMEYPALTGEMLKGSSFDDDFEMFWAMNTRMEEGSLARFWGSLQQAVRPAISVWTAIPIVPEKMEPFTRVTERKVRYRNTNDPHQAEEEGPQKNRFLLSRDDLIRGGTQ